MLAWRTPAVGRWVGQGKTLPGSGGTRPPDGGVSLSLNLFQRIYAQRGGKTDGKLCGAAGPGGPGGGIALLVTEPVQPGSLLFVELETRPDARPVRVWASVVRCTEAGESGWAVGCVVLLS